MKFDELKMEELRNDESYLIDGGLLAGGLAGGILGGTVGLIIATGKGIATGSLSGNELWKCYVSGAMTGGAIGALYTILEKRRMTMETFKRYLLHFSGIATIILLIAYILIYIDGGELHNPIFILFLAFSLQFFAFFITLFSYSMAKIKVIEFVYESENVKELEELIMSLTHREEVKDMGTEVLYLFKNKYKAWLAGTIKLEKQDGIYKLYVPNAYTEKIIRNNKIKVTNILLA